MRFTALLLAALLPVSTGCDLKVHRRTAPPPPKAPSAPARPSAEAVEAAAWEEVEAKSAALVASQQFGAALRHLDAELPFHKARADRIRALREAVLAGAQVRAAELEKEAQAAVEKGDAEAAHAAWRAAMELDVVEISDRVRALMQEGELTLHRRSHAGAQPYLGPTLLELQKYLLARDTQASMKFLSAAIAAHPELRQEFDWLRGTVIEADGVFASVQAGLNKMKDSTVTLGAESVTVTGATAEAASFRTAAGGKLDVPLAEIPPDLFLKAALQGGHSADFVGQFLLFTGRLAEARAAFKGLNRPDLDTLADSVERSLSEMRK